MKDSKLMNQSNKRKLRFNTFGSTKRVKYNQIPNNRKPRKATMNDLPNEILLEVFYHLRRPDLLNLTLVNKNFNSLISNTKKTMRKLNTLHINDRNMQNGIPTLTRKYEKIDISEITEWNLQLLKCLKSIGRNIKIIEMFECVFFDDDFKRILECFENLETLELWDCHPGISPINNLLFDRKVNLNALKYLVLKGYAWPLRLINTPQLEFFEAESLTLYDQEWLIDFLNHQTQLETLHLIGISDLFDSRFGILDVQFNLKKLVLYDLLYIDQAQCLSMLSRVKSSVECVDLGFNLRRDICEYILKNFEAMTTFSIDCDCLPKSVRFYDQMIPNYNLKSATIFGCVTSSNNVLQFLRTHPGIEILRLKSLSNLHSTKFTFWSEFSKTTPKVRCLTIGNLEAYNMVYLKSNSLKHLDVDFIGRTDKNVWLDFCKNNPNIEDFHVFRMGKHLEGEIEKIIRDNLPKLKDIYVKSSK